MGHMLSRCLGGDARLFIVKHRRCYVKRRLGEGAFSFVDLVEEAGTRAQYAMKRIQCPEQADVECAMKEAEYHRIFDEDTIVTLVDADVVDSKAVPGQKEVVLLFPLYQQGTLQDRITKMAANGTRFSEHELVSIFRGICLGVRHLHQCSVTSLCHRDLKPANVLLAEDGSPVLMDFGSMQRGKIEVTNRKEALQCQDVAAEHSTLPYRAPELVDVPSACLLTTKADIWSLGCLLYTMAYFETPFEYITSKGGSINLAIAQGKIDIPNNDPYSEELKNFIRWLLTIDPEERPDIDEVLNRLESL